MVNENYFISFQHIKSNALMKANSTTFISEMETAKQIHSQIPTSYEQ